MRPRRRILPFFIPHQGCPNQCVFCDQRKITGCEAPDEAAQIAAALKRLPDGADYELAFYGGSFTAIPVQRQEALLSAAVEARQRGAVGPLRISTRPDAIDAPTLERLRSCGVKTVELGAQSMDEAVLCASRRGHTPEDTRRAAAMVKAAGFALILQMMTGLPGCTPASDLATAREIIALRPDGVRIYPTVILRGTELEALWKTGAYQEHTVEDAVSLCAGLLPLFDAAGIPVIRLGLNPTESLSQADAVGGAYHPALGELVRSRILRNTAEELLRETSPGADAVLRVPYGRRSAMTGQHRCNIRYLQEKYHLSALRVEEGDTAGKSVLLFCRKIDQEG